MPSSQFSDPLRRTPAAPTDSERGDFKTDADPNGVPVDMTELGTTRLFVPTINKPPNPIPAGVTVDLRGPAAAGSVGPRHEARLWVSLAGGRYLVGEEIGRGGVGVVFDGWDLQLEREVAVKVLHDEHRDKPEIVRRFLEEARITAKLQHPGIVAIHELGTTRDDRPYFVMRMVRGQTLEQILRRRESASEDLSRLLNIFLQISQAVAYAHNLGMIHRDLKPANIMVGAFGVVKVMDWGLAKILGDPDLPDAIAAARATAELSRSFANREVSAESPFGTGTQIGTVFGTPAYLPPEQARGEIDRIDKRADVFGLGSILCEILTRFPPYTGADGREIFDKAVAADIGEMLARLNTSPGALDLISLAKWCLSPDRHDRPADAAEVVEVMTAHLQAVQRRAEQDLVRFFDLSLDLFCIASTDGFFLRINDNFPRVLGHSVEELTTRPFLDFVHADDKEDTMKVLAKLSVGEPCVQFQNRYRHAHGHYLWLEWNAQSVPEERSVYAVARDVTERVNLAEAHRRLEQSSGQTATP